MTYLEQLLWRYATKKFNPNLKVSNDSLSQIKEAIRLAPSSYGLMPYKILEIIDHEKRELLKVASYGQPQITDADRIFVFCARNDIDSLIAEYQKIARENNSANEEQLEGWKNMIKGVTDKMDTLQIISWVKNQAYIALGFGLSVCAYLGVDSCPMEGFDRDEYKKILNLDSHFFPCMILAVGYRDQADMPRVKVRNKIDELFIKI